MRLKAALLAGVSLAALASPAHADPILTPLTLTLFAASPVWVSPGLIYAGLQALTVGAFSVGSALLSRQTSKADPNTLSQVTAGAEGPGRYATGRVLLAGKIAFGNTDGYDIWKLMLHCFGVLAAVEEYFYDGRSIVVEADGSVSSPPFGLSSGSFLLIQTKAGDGTETAWSALISAFPDLWTSDHRARGITQSLVRFTNPGTTDDRFSKLLTGGVKTVTALCRVGQFYDPRDDTTDWTLNGVIQCLHWFRQLPGMTDALIDFDDIALVADEGDALVATIGGTTPRCLISGGWDGPLTTDIMLGMLDSAGLEVRTTAAGKYTFAFIADDPDSELTITKSHILDIQYQEGPEGVQRPNTVKLTYFSPERNYETAQIDLTNADWSRNDDEIAVYGDHEQEIALTFCCHAGLAQRLARRKFHMARAASGTLLTDWAGMAAIDKRVISFELDDVGNDGGSIHVKARIDAPRINDADGTVEIPFTVIPEILQTPFSSATDEVAAPPVLPSLQYASELDTPVAPSAATLVQYWGGGAYETRFQCTEVSGAATAEASYRTYTGGLPNAWASMDGVYEGFSGTWYAYEAADLRDAVDFRVRFFNAAGESSYFSPLLAVDPLTIDNTACAAPTVTEGDPDPSELSIIPRGLNVVAVKIEYKVDAGSWIEVTTQNARPIQTLVVNIPTVTPVLLDQIVYWRVTPYTTDGTPGSQATGDYTIPGTGGA